LLNLIRKIKYLTDQF